jgi:hypothetical protein
VNGLASERRTLDDPADYSDPEVQERIRTALPLILEIREHANGPLARKVQLYERTLGLAVVPVLVRRLILKLLARRRVRRPIDE